MTIKRIFTLSGRVSSRNTRRAICRTKRHGAFTLVELLVVIAIAAVVSGITLSGYRTVADGNARVSCQTNLTQIYSAIQLYSKDYDGYYPYYDPAATLDGTKGLGLWALYGFRSDASSDKIADFGDVLAGSQHNKPFGVYIRSRKQLHCPADADNADFFSDAAQTITNMNFLSYQVLDGTEQTYQPWRGVTDDTLWNAKRQLLRFRTTPPGSSTLVSPTQFRRTFPADDAVITWCPWHRGVREIDNVLFASGAVRPVPRVQANPDYPVSPPQPAQPPELQGWNRKPPF